MDIQSLINTVEGASKISRISDHLHTFSLNYNSTAQSQFFIEDALKFPSSYEEFLNHQASNLETSFFTAEGNLQWNIYYYLVVEDTKYDLLKESELFQQIENDRKFARKKIVAKSKISEIYPFIRLLKKHTEQESTPDLVEVWRSKLPAEFEVLFSDAKRIGYDEIHRLYYDRAENALQATTPARQALNVGWQEHEVKHLKTLSLTKYRDYPTTKDFTFGKVNLIDGSNGVGKTSLLESIEIVLCGSSYRSGDKSDQYKISLGLQSPQKVLNYPLNPKSIYSERQLSWYSVPTKQNINRLSEQFARYNFFNTDAAFDLAKGKDKVELDAAINSIIAGPEASQIESRIRRLEEEFKTGDRQLDLSSKSLLEQIETLERSLEEKRNTLKSASFEVDIIREDAKAIGINPPSEFDEKKLSLIENHARQLSAQITEIRKCADHLNPLTSGGVREYINTVEIIMNELKTRFKDQEAVSSEIKQRASEKKEILNQLESLKRYKLYIAHPMATNLKKLIERIKYLEAKITSDENVFHNHRLDSAGSDLRHLVIYPSSITEIIATLKDNKDKIQQEVDATNKDIHKRQSEKQSLDSKVGQLKQLAHNVIKAHQLSNCPICDHTYAHLDLLKKSLEQVSTEDLSLTALITKKDDLEKDLKKAKETLTDCEKLSLIGSLINGATEKSLSTPAQILEGIENFNQTIVKNRQELITTELSLKAIQDEGFSLAELGELHALPHIKDLSNESLQSIQDSIDSLEETTGLLTVRISELEIESTAAADLFKSSQQRMKDLFPETGSTSDVKVVINKLQNGLQQISEFILNLQDDANLIDVQASSIRVANYLENALRANKEAIVNSSAITETEKQLAQKKLEKNSVARRKTQCSEALSIFKDIRENHSVESFARGFLEENIELIQSIFASVHSPNEFEKISFSGGIKLTKAGTERTLDEVSTGQRSALALSVFVGMHLSSPRAPKFLIFDDPISFIDDLNVLSFLDLLRELVVSMDRQVFFATANNKLASLFKRKFGFLGDDFKSLSFKR